nr:MAG: hypothetical protein [Microviridae sp.]
MSNLFYETHRSYDFAQSFAPTPDWVSLTVPDQVLSLAEIISRYSRGQSLPPIAMPVGNTELDTSDFDHMDKFDKLTAARQAKQRAIDLEDQLTIRKSTLAKAKQQKAFDAAVDAKAKSLIKPDETKQS